MISQLLILSTLLPILTHAQSSSPAPPVTTSIEPIFHLPIPNIPSSLEASVVTSYLTTLSSGLSPDYVITYVAACPSAISPENDACRALSRYPAEFWHTQGSVYGGVFTDRQGKQTMSWTCALGSSGQPLTLQADCERTIVEDGVIVTRGSGVFTDECVLVHASVPLVITAGVEKLDGYSWEGKLSEVTQYLSAYESVASSISCPSRPSLTAPIANPSARVTSSLPFSSSSPSSPSPSAVSPSSTSSTNLTITSPPISNPTASIIPAVTTSTRSGSERLRDMKMGTVWTMILVMFACILW